FENFRVDKDNFRLTRDGQNIPLEPIVFDLLVALAEQAGHVMTRDDVINKVWNGRFVSDSTVSTALKALRKALGDTGAEQRLIRTVRGRGFEFIGKIEDPEVPLARPTTNAPPDPVIYVHASTEDADASTHIQSRALAARIRTVLGRIPLLRVLAPSAQPTPHAGHEEMRARHGVTLLADLFLLRSGDTIRVEAALIDTSDGTQAWSRSYSETFEDIASDAFLHRLVRHLEPAIVRAMVAGVSAASDDDPRALLLRAVSLLSQKGWRATTFQEAESLLESAVDTDPSLALAHANLALIRAIGHRMGITRDDETIVRRAIAAADHAIDLESQDSMTLGLAGCALADAGEVRRALPILERAVETDPDNGHAKTALGAAIMQTRDFERAEELLDAGIRISPADSRLGVWCTVQAMAQLKQGKTEAAEASLANAIREDFQLYMPHVGRIALALAQSDEEAARSAAQECLRTRPDVTQAEMVGLIGRRAGEVAWSLVPGRGAPTGSDAGQGLTASPGATSTDHPSAEGREAQDRWQSGPSGERSWVDLFVRADRGLV
ncbi:MAG: winged helix-turn-helix domain-containing protein, partial [Pseudomonadota bacterium]